jgi:hypothetical protein
LKPEFMMSAYLNQSFSALVVAVCAVLLLRVFLGTPRRAKFDAVVLRFGTRLRNRAIGLWHWRRRRAAAARLAREAILRARRMKADKDGKVIRPEAFKEPRKPH